MNNERKGHITADEILLSVGRTPNVEDLRLAVAKVEFDREQGSATDNFLATTNPRIYAADDVCMEYRFANVAEASVRMAVDNLLRAQRTRRSELFIPWCTREQSIPVKRLR